MLLVTDQHDDSTAVAEPTRANWGAQQYFDPDFRAHVAAELDKLRHLREGWDGYRAAPIDPQIIDAARGLVFSLPENIAPRPRVVPLINGTLQLEWIAGEKSLEFEFENERTIHYLQWDPASEMTDEESFEVMDGTRAESLIRWFTRHDVL